MAKVRQTKSAGVTAYMLQCPGCKHAHVIYTGADPEYQKQWEAAHARQLPIWGFNGDLDRPTFHPSLLVTSPEHRQGGWNIPATCCHSFIRDGNIEFLLDCTHELAGKTVPLPDFD